MSARQEESFELNIVLDLTSPVVRLNQFSEQQADV